jgi:hypothetical protein
MFVDVLAFNEISRSASMLRLSCAGRSYRQQDCDHACVQKRYSTNLPKVDEGIYGVSTATLPSSIGTSSNSFVGASLTLGGVMFRAKQDEYQHRAKQTTRELQTKNKG